MLTGISFPFIIRVRRYRLAIKIPKLRTDDFDYRLPPELIAQEPLEKRDNSRLLVLERSSGDIRHSSFARLPLYLEEGNLLVLNDTRVLPARLLGKRKDTGGKIELLLLRRLEGSKWETLSSPGKRAIPGTVLVFGDGLLEAEVLERTNSGGRIVLFKPEEPLLSKLLQMFGKVPLPPYIKKHLQDGERYQTVYARREGSAAAPTAGLHFTPSVFNELSLKGIDWIYLTLHIGTGTFRPVKDEYVQNHVMHSEYYELPAAVAEKINAAKEKGKKVFAVGTTCCRVLETLGDENGRIRAGRGETDIFIYPEYKFNIVDALITNFHLPRSTLLMLVCAFAGRENTLRAYEEAIERDYRFYSFGDCMLVI